MDSISKIKLNDTDYAIKDARIVGGTLEGNSEVTFTGSEIMVFVTDGNVLREAFCANDKDTWDNEPNWAGITSRGDSTYILGNDNQTSKIWYIAIIIE